MSRFNPTSRTVILVLALIPLAVSAWANPAFSGTAGDSDHYIIVLKNGESISVTDFKVDRTYKVLKVETAKGKDAISFHRIGSILKDGEDVTRDILGEGWGGPSDEAAAPSTPSSPAAPDVRPAPDIPAEQVWTSETSPDYIERNKAPWPLCLHFNGVFTNPSGDYYQGTDGSGGFEFGLAIGLNHYVALRFTIAKAGISIPGISELSSFSAMRYSFGGQVFKHLNQSRRDGSLLYGYAEVGALVHNWEVSLAALGQEMGSAVVSDSQTGWVTTIGGGLTKALGRNVGLDGSVGLDLVQVPSSSDSYYYQSVSTTTGFLLNLKLGMFLSF